jgi:hypothetical protein
VRVEDDVSLGGFDMERGGVGGLWVTPEWFTVMTDATNFILTYHLLLVSRTHQSQNKIIQISVLPYLYGQPRINI